MTMSDPPEAGGNGGIPLVERDGYDEAAFERVLARHHALRDAIESGSRLMPGFAALAHDIFSLLFKYSVVRRDPPPSAALSDRMLDWIEGADGFERLKAETTLDEARAGYACARLVARTLAALKNPELFSTDELLSAFEAQTLEVELDEIREQIDAANDLLDRSRDATHASESADAPPDAAAETGDVRSGEPGSGRGSERIRRALGSLEDEAAKLEKALAALRDARERQLDDLPARLQSHVRITVDELPERISTGEAEADAFADAIAGPGAGMEARAKLELGERLADNEKVRRLARLVGAFRQVALGVRRRRFERRPAEVHEIERSDQLARVLPSELVQLRHPTRRRDVLRRFVEGDLLAYSVHGKSRAGRGPMVVCIDGSGSMRGARELWAKAVALTLLEIGRRQRRAVQAFVFSAHPDATRGFELTPETDGQRTVLTPQIDFESVVGFADYFPGGGTSFRDPLDRAVAVLRDESRFKRGDIVLVTDGQARLPAAWREGFEAAREALDFELHAVLVDVAGPGRPDVLESLADTVVSITELTADAARELFAAV